MLGPWMRTLQALCSVPLNKVVLILSTSVVHYVQIRCQQNRSVRKKVLGCDSTSFDALGTGTPTVPSTSNFMGADSVIS